MNAHFSFSNALLAWFDHAGRKHLPWQQNTSPYRVWISEIMLQQTQVNTVIPYFDMFMRRFPDLPTLAKAPLDDVLAAWTGLGYYSRARNLHKAACTVMGQHGGVMPDNVDALSELPGIGRSTAAAIVAIAHGKAATILDGNVKRVLARFHAVEGWPGNKDVENALWAFAESHTPSTRCADYTQAIMDLGATVCTRTRPDCMACPLQNQCLAYKHQSMDHYPGKKMVKALPIKTVQMLMMVDDRERIFLQQRPPKGLWGGLWCLPEIPPGESAVAHCQVLCAQTPSSVSSWPSWRHTFSHFHLDITPMLLEVKRPAAPPYPNQRWVHPMEAHQLGMPTPLLKLLKNMGYAQSSKLTPFEKQRP